MQLLVTPASVRVSKPAERDGAEPVPEGSDGFDDGFGGTDSAAWRALGQELLTLRGGVGQPPPSGDAGGGGVAPLLALTQASSYRYPRRPDVPAVLRGEQLPPLAADFEAKLVEYVDFSPAVLASRLRTRTALQRTSRDLFAGVQVDETIEDIWAQLEPAAVAERAEQIRLRLQEANDRELHGRLADRFRAAVVASGAEPPEDEEELLQQLDLVQVRHPGLLRDAWRRLRLSQVQDIDVTLPAELHSDSRLEAARRASFGVFPPGLNQDELEIARRLDADPQVLWWHRNLPSRPDSIGLYRWDDGRGFFPDFVVAMRERPTSHGIALLEIKGGPLWGEPLEVDKADAVHPEYGAVFMAGRRRGETAFSALRRLGDRLERDGEFSIGRLRFV
jgi:hypothetical protein